MLARTGLAVVVFSCVLSALSAPARADLPTIDAQMQRGAPPSATGPIPGQQIPGRNSTTASIQGIVRDTQGNVVPGATITAISEGGQPQKATSNGEGIFRLVRIPVGNYKITAEATGYSPQSLASTELKGGALLTVVVRLQATTILDTSKGASGMPGISTSMDQQELPSAYGNDIRSLKSPTPWPLQVAPEVIPPSTANFNPAPDRWNAQMPGWDRYGRPGEFPYTKSHWYNPFNQNILKGDKPIFGQQWFLNFTGTSLTGLNVRRVPVPSGISAENAGDEGFFGRGEQSFVTQSFILSFDLFHGDTSFRPIDWRFRFTPEFNLNFLQTRERGIVNVDVREGTNRFDTHIGIQEAFVEAKLHDLSPNFDFVSVRAGIQEFVSDFRGFIFAEQQPGIRVFGNLKSNRLNYNLAYFYFLEKDTNSGLNTFNQRHQQVYIGNVYIQDFLTKGYTTEFSFHYNRDDPSVEYDNNGFLVRPAPVGVVVQQGTPGSTTPPLNIIQHGIRAYYLGWTSNGHIGRINVNHAFYQALGHDTFNPIAGRYVDINAQMGALELSLDKDWARYYVSMFYASGDGSHNVGAFRQDHTAHGFDTIVDETNFAGGPFSYFDQQGIGLLSTGVSLTTPLSLLTALRSSKLQGQANFVNPGAYIFNAGANFKVTTNLTAFANTSWLQFARTEPLEILLFQENVHHAIGQDVGFGVRYRPKLSDNIIFTGGTSALFPAAGFNNLYNSKVLLSGFGTIALTF
jgi:hypothetical protein